MKNLSIKTIYLLCSVILSVVAVFGINAYIQGKVKPTEVWVFTRDLKANSKISETDVTVIEIPKSAVKESFFVGKQEEIIGKYVFTDVYQDQYVLNKQVVAGNETDPFKSMNTRKLRKISIPGNMVETAGVLNKGDRVDLLYHGTIIDTNSDKEETHYGKIFMQNIPIYDLITAEGTQITNASDVAEGEEFNPFYEYIVVAVTPEQAEEILTRLEYSTISVVSRFDDSESEATSGFAINDVPSPDKLPFIGEAQVEIKEATILD